MALITYEQAAYHLRIPSETSSPPSELETDVRLKMEQATALVLNYIKWEARIEDETHDDWADWTDETDASVDVEFALVQAAILKVLKNLDMFRGDEETPHDPLEGVIALLSPLRDPTLV